MFPSFRECQKRIHNFDSNVAKHHSTFDLFWSYKLTVEQTGSILDSDHLDETARLLNTYLLRHPQWGLWWTGIPPVEQIKEILKRIRSEYKIIKNVKLGQNQLVTDRNVSLAICRIYKKLCGITHTHTRFTDPDPLTGEYYIVGKSKVLMFLWGQTPGFDTNVVDNLSLQTKGLPLCAGINQYTPREFYETLKILDSWVQSWNQKYSGRGVSFENLSPKRPIGRIIDILYFKE
jgi:hypothetical protein